MGERRSTMIETADRARRLFRREFGDDPQAVSWAPGRLEILGNHTDYNGGHVLAVALDLGISIAASKLDALAPRLEVTSETFSGSVSAPLDPIERSDVVWANYPLGVLREIAALGVQLPSLRLAIASSLPLGAGVSSSAALELATAEAVFELCGGRPIDRLEEAKLCQRAEADFVGKPCGLLDQFSSAFGCAHHVLYLDCSTLDFSHAPLGDELTLVIADTNVKHALIDGEYAALRQHCENACQRLSQLLGRPLSTLRDATLEEFEEHADRVDEPDRRRAEHVFRENRRVLDGLAALEHGDVRELGEVMLASHESSRDLFGNSCAELDAVVEIARGLPGFIGGKLSGGGLGGATVLLVEKTRVHTLLHELESAYARRFPARLGVHITSAGGGARVLSRPAHDGG